MQVQCDRHAEFLAYGKSHFMIRNCVLPSQHCYNLTFVAPCAMLAFTAVDQGVLEKLYHKVYFQLDIYLHGGLTFMLISSACFSVVSSIVWFFFVTKK